MGRRHWLCASACTPGDENTNGDCVGGSCQYSCKLGFGSCDGDDTTCEVDFSADGDCGACGKSCATAECTSLGDEYACNDPIDIAAGTDHTCALRADGSVWCWGVNTFGQLGTASGVQMEPFPGKMDLPAIRFTRIEAFSGRTCALSEEGELHCTVQGNNQSPPVHQDLGQVVHDFSVGSQICVLSDDNGNTPGCFTSSSAGSPSLSSVGAAGAKRVASGGGHVCVIRSNDHVQCHGSNDFGQAGDASLNAVSAPGFEITSFEAAGLGAGAQHTCALDKAGALRCWGSNMDRQSGGFSSVQPDPVVIATNVARYIAGPRHNALLPSGAAELWAWGDNATFQVAETGTDRQTPAEYRSIAGTILDVANGGGHTCVLLETGVITCWGTGTSGQLGNGSLSTSAAAVDVEWN